MALVYRVDADGPGVFLVTRDSEQRIAHCASAIRPTDDQMIRVEMRWFTSARYPEPLSHENYLRAIATPIPPAMPRGAVHPWDAKP